MNTKYIALILIIAAVAFASVGVYLLQSNSQGSENTPAVVEVVGDPVVTITRTSEGYEPKEVTIQRGDIVLFTNESGEFHWPASDLHPTHGVYPEFDPQRPIAEDEDWKFKFDQAGVWEYHDHVRANKTGTITVTE